MSEVLPQGKGMFIWKIKNAEGGDVDAIAAQAQAMGLQWVAAKVNSGPYGYNWRKLPNGQWVDDYIPMLKAALDGVGVELWGWGSVHLLDGRREAQVAVDRTVRFGLKGYLMDAESQAKESPDRYHQANLYAAEMNAHMQGAVGLCSYRYPQYHPELPWNELLACCDFHAPQVYWVQSHNPAWQLQHSMENLVELADLPFVPAGPAFDEHGWKPTVAEMDAFHEAAVDLECLGEIWWEWDEADDNGYHGVIAAHEWEQPAPEPTLAEKVAALEAWQAETIKIDAGHDAAIAGILDWIAEHEGTPEPPPESTLQVTVTNENGVPAFSYKAANKKGNPIMIYNVFQESGDPDLKWYKGESVTVDPGMVQADGGLYWYEVKENLSKHGYPALYVRADLVE